MLTKTSESSKFVEIIRGKHIKVKRKTFGPVHLDGEPQIMDADAEIIDGATLVKCNCVGADYKVKFKDGQKR